MPGPPRFRIVLAKEDFKFSVAHFTLFGGTRAELLHGHNYRVSLELSGRDLDSLGLLVDIDGPKQAVREICARLDGRTLLPADSPALVLSHADGAVEVRFGDRRYTFPEADVLTLPLANTSIELLARRIWQELAPRLKATRVETLAVSVEETDGQRCLYEAPLPSW